MLKSSLKLMEEVYQLLNSLELRGIQNARILSMAITNLDAIVKEEAEAISIDNTKEGKND